MKQTIHYLLTGLVLSAAWAPECRAQTLAAPQIRISDDQKLMFEAAQQVMRRDYKAANAIYSQAIAINGGNIEAYLQRAIVRRELNDRLGMTNDASTAITLANSALQSNNMNPTLYYQRGMGFRLLQNFAQARKDITAAIQLGGPAGWQTDLQALELEETAASPVE